MSINYNGTNIESIKYNGTDLTKVTYNGTVVWEKQQPLNTPLTITAIEDCWICIDMRGSGLPTIQYSLDGNTWSTYTYGTDIRVYAGNYIQFWNSSTNTFSIDSNNYAHFWPTTKRVVVSGNCNSLINYSNTAPAYCFYRLFNDSTHDWKFTTAPELPATTLGRSCYEQMFYGISSLTTPPELPATTLAMQCYAGMFQYCTSLTTSPELPATTLANNCYSEMFQGCTSLTIPPELRATDLASACYFRMFASSGLTIAPELPATTLYDYCYYEMFRNCESLTTVPELPATTLANNCYQQMFYYCENLQVSDTQTADAQYAWRLPTSGTFTTYSYQADVFNNCLGTRASDGISAYEGESKTYYTQNLPI